MSDRTDSDLELINKINELTMAENKNAMSIEYVTKDVKDVKDSVDALAKKVEDYYVNNDVFYPVKTLVYGFTGGILLTILFAVLSLILIPKITITPSVSPNAPISIHSSNGTANDQ
jgi:hypothetical protein